MKAKTLQHMQMAQTPEHYDQATHAVIEVDDALVGFLSRKMLTAKAMAADDSSFNSLSFTRYDAEFIDFNSDQCDLVEADFEHYMDGNVGVILPDGFVVGEDERAAIDCMTLHVTPTEFWWEGFDKYAGNEGFVTTYRFCQSHLDNWNERLGGVPLIWHGGLTWLGLQRMIGTMRCDSDNVTVLMPNGEFCGVRPIPGMATEDDVLDKGHQFLILQGDE